tara:strand:+ start:527 stop:1393 length:867 start_codon:yes stop_codon:yes gene_type:complete
MLSHVFLGTAQFGLNYGATNKVGKLSKTNISRILDKSKDLGVIGLDTSPNYGDSEIILGDLGIKNFEICTKLPSISATNQSLKRTIKNHIETSLKNLKIDCIDYYLLHDEKNLYQENSDEILEELLQHKKNGLLKKIGISIYSYSQLMNYPQKEKLDLVQGPYNLADSRFYSSGLCDFLEKKKIEFHARSIFLQGILLADHETLPYYFKKYKKFFSKLNDLEKKLQCNKLELCLNYVLNSKKISASIIGIDSYEHLNEIFEAANKKIELFELNCNSDEDFINPQRWNL